MQNPNNQKRGSGVAKIDDMPPNGKRAKVLGDLVAGAAHAGCTAQMDKRGADLREIA